jgi:hypothetical protein
MMPARKTEPETVSDAQLDQITRRTAEILADQPKRKVRLHQVPKGSSEKPLPDETVCINGHIYQIQRGVEVEVPESVYLVLEQASRL